MNRQSISRRITCAGDGKGQKFPNKAFPDEEYYESINDNPEAAAEPQGLDGAYAQATPNQYEAINQALAADNDQHTYNKLGEEKA